MKDYGEKDFEHGLVAKIKCPSAEKCPLRELAEKKAVQQVQLVKIIKTETRASRITSILTIIGFLLMAILLLYASRAHAENSKQFQQTNDYGSLRIADAELAGRIVALEKIAQENRERIARIELRQADDEKEVGRIQGIGGALMGFMALINIILQLSKRSHQIEAPAEYFEE